MTDTINNSPLGKISTATFLSEYWQKKPLLVRHAFTDFNPTISAEELAGLSYEEEVNSRIVIEKGGDYPWQAISGPMDDDIFASMPESHWTLVVNDLEKYCPELSWITDKFRFLPEWHLDDLMSSWAADQGTVGPHIDLYDVFIIQGKGKRRWQISTTPVSDDNYIPDIDIRLQKDFTPEQEWILETGDMMYLPAGVSHHGVSLGESMSYSVGYRATSHSDLVNDFIAHITQDLSINKTYRLPDKQLAAHPNEISTAAIDELRSIFSQYLDPQHPKLAQWFGQYVSDPKIDYLVTEAEEQVESFSELQLQFTELNRHPSSRFAFISHHDKSCSLFIDGDEYSVSYNFAKTLCDKRNFELAKLAKLATTAETLLIIDLYNLGKLF